MISIVNSGGANLSSIQYSLNRLGVTAELTNNDEVIKKSTHIILPGVGSANSAMTCLKQFRLIDVIRSLTQPVLGICLGMQILFEYSEEGNVDCLGLIPGKIKKMDKDDKTLILPHMGWNTLEIIDEHSIMKNISQQAYVYFTHSYSAAVGNYTSAISNYGSRFSAAINYQNFHGTQFHPEKSSDVGQLILKNFLEL